MNRTNNRALTLTELLLAASLMGLVVITAVNLEMASRGYHFSSDREGRLQVQLSIALEHMVKNISLVHAAEPNFPGITIPAPGYAGDSSIEFRRDVQVSGKFTPQDYSDDAYMRYWQEGVQLKFCSDASNCPATTEVICSGRVKTLKFTPNFTATKSNLEITLTGEDAISSPAISIALHSYVFPRSDARSP